MLVLERALSRRGFSISEALEDFADAPHSFSSHISEAATRTEASTDSEEDSSVEDEEDVVDLDRLHLDDLRTSNLIHYGPTSALNHLHSAPQSLQSPLISEHDISPLLSGNNDELAWLGILPDIGMSIQTHHAIIELFESFFSPWCWVRRTVRS